jgi:MtN3 and saliva related transmembrane protein
MNEGKITVFLERLMIFVAVVGPFANLPQLLKIWIKKKTNGVSMVSWILFSILSLVWLIYGIVKKDKYIIITFGITLILQLLIVIGTVIY